MQTLSKICRGAALLALAVVLPVRGAGVTPEIIESLTVGSITYTNVELMHRTKSDLFIRHAGGVLSVKVKNLDKSTQLQLGYQLADPAPTNAVASSSLPEIEIDPRYEELSEKVIWESKEFLSKLDPKIFYGAGGIVLVLYLFFCWCCQLICRKTGQRKLALVWFPLLKQVPLLRAANMSPWWILTNLLPPAFGVVFIVWSFKIAKARRKGLLTGFLLLLPLVNVFAFLYLAFADEATVGDQQAGKGKVLSYQQSPRRAA